MAGNPRLFTRTPLRAGPSMDVHYYHDDNCRLSTSTYCEAEAESDISNGVDTAVDRVVSLVNNPPQLWHHGAVHHPYSEAKASHG